MFLGADLSGRAVSWAALSYRKLAGPYRQAIERSLKRAFLDGVERKRSTSSNRRGIPRFACQLTNELANNVHLLAPHPGFGRSPLKLPDMQNHLTSVCFCCSSGRCHPLCPLLKPSLAQALIHRASLTGAEEQSGRNPQTQTFFIQSAIHHHPRDCCSVIPVWLAGHS